MVTITDLTELLRSGDYPDLPSLNADRRTRGPISLQQLGTLLHRLGLGRVLKGLANDEAVPEPIRGTISDFLEYAADPRQQWLGTDEHDIAQRLRDLLDLLLTLEHLTAAQAVQIYALGGGLRVPEPVVQETYDAALARIEREDAAAAALAEYDTAANATRNAYAHALDQWIEHGGSMPEAA